MSGWQEWSQQIAASIRAAYRDETGQINPASMAIQHTVLFKFPDLKDDAPLQAVVEQFNALEGSPCSSRRTAPPHKAKPTPSQP